MSIPILATKLYPPPIRVNAVRRTHLLERLAGNLNRGGRLTLVSAPAGYGKSTLVRDWLDYTSCRYVWLSLDDSDNDPVRFLSYLTAALQPLGEVGGAVQNLLGATQRPSIDAVMSLLVNDLVLLPDSFILVLDDLHLISHEDVCQALRFLVNHQPPSMHLCLITRQDPPLGLPGLRASGQLSEVRVDDLRFSPAEAGVFFQDTMDIALRDDVVEALASRTEGWVAGLQLAALSLLHSDETQIDEFVRAFSGSHRYVIDYLVDEVLRQQTEEVREFLLQTSVLERLDTDLCNYLTGREDSRKILNQLEEKNLFLISLDDRREWYRYHHLFADALRADLNDEYKAKLHLQAAVWFETRGYLPEAVSHALASGHFVEAARLITKAIPEAFCTAELTTCLLWLQALPEEVIQADGALSVYKAWVLLLNGQIQAAATWTAEFEGSLSAVTPAHTRGLLACLKAWLANVTGQSGGEALARQALDLLSNDDLLSRVEALLALGQTQSRSGRTKDAVKTFRQAYKVANEIGHTFSALVALANLVFDLNTQGQRREALRLCHEALNEYTDRHGRLLPIAHFILIPLGYLQYEANELTAARENVTRGLDVCQKLFSSAMFGGDAEQVLALVYLAQGKVEKALEIAGDLRRTGEKVRVKRLEFIGAALEAYLHLRGGHCEFACQWVDSTGFTPDEWATIGIEIIPFTYVRLLLAEGRIEEACLLLERMESLAVADNRGRSLITIHLLQAQAHAIGGCLDRAVQRLEPAIKLAEAEGYRCAFLEEGPTLAFLLAKARHLAPDFVDDLLRCFTVSGTPVSNQAKLIEPLSERELEVLELVAQGLSNSQIAQKLVITVGTAKWHVHNLFGKLGVSRRTQLVSRARELKLI